ncbi:MAG: glycoside hydrolase family protein [Rikenellaceae bacterium]
MKHFKYSTLVTGLLILSLPTCLFAQTGKLVEGAQFIDRFLHLEEGRITSDCWGDSNVVPRNVDNGIEDSTYSYWGGNIVVGDDGKYHMFVASWREDKVKGDKSGHMTWSDSDVVHAVSDSPTGPYKRVSIVGKGHNPEIYRKKDGTYVIGILGSRAYTSKSLYGEWEEIPATFDILENPLNSNDRFYRKSKTDDSMTVNQSNRTYIVEDDGSIFMMNKEGHVFRSEDGSENFKELDAALPYCRRNDSHEEDPVIWKDEVCYNLLVNDCAAKVAYHLTSKDGLRWDYEDGIAFKPGVGMFINKNGVEEDWGKIERPKVLTDKYGRVLYMNFAVIDVKTSKKLDLANDNHSSKNIVVPMKVAKRSIMIERERASRESISFTVKILAEDGFFPTKDIDVSSIRFGSAKLVNYGGGAKVVSSYNDGNDLVLKFDGALAGLNPDDYKAKIMGSDVNGDFIFSNVRLIE